MNNREVAHLWANRSRERASGSHFYFEGDTIYSYGTHFPIARHYRGVILFTTRSYSNTTAKHKGYVWSACSHLERFHVEHPSDNPNGKDVTHYGKQIEFLALKAAKARNPAARLEVLEATVKEANDFCSRFGFKTRFAMPENLDALREKAKASAERERQQKIAKQAKFDRHCAETVQLWLNGDAVTIPHQYSKTLLRVRSFDGDCPVSTGGEPKMETSKGAKVPLSEAEKAFRFAMAMRERGWHRNGEQFKVGDYQLDAINEQGVVAGCHRVAWDEIERFAKLQGWMK